MDTVDTENVGGAGISERNQHSEIPFEQDSASSSGLLPDDVDLLMLKLYSMCAYA